MVEKVELNCLVNDSSSDVVMNLHEDINFRIDFKSGSFTFSAEGNQYWEALLNLRVQLEANDIKLLCLGCSKDVYPSPMILNMGDARLAYKLRLGQKAQKKDLVCIFDPCAVEDYSTIAEQQEYYSQWVASCRSGGRL